MRLLEGLDADQRRAVLSDAQPLCILAGAGSGKTRVLTRRIAHRVASGDADAAHVLALTFTRKAAGELRSRLDTLLRGDGAGGAAGVPRQCGVVAGTFHAVAYAQLRRRWGDRGERAPVLLDRKVRLLAPLLPRARAAAGSSATLQAADLAAEIEWAKARIVPPSRYEAEAEAAGRTPPLPAAAMAALYERYEHDKRRKGLIDFDDVLAACATALEDDPEFAAAQRWRFRHFFVDEFQDVNPAQFRLLRGWLGDRLDLCVVGDPNQAVYSWNGADPTLLTDVRTHFPGADVLRLARNYRSTPQVVAVAGAVLAGTGADGDAEAGSGGARGTGAGGGTGAGAGWGGTARAARQDGPIPVIRQFDTDVGEAQGVARSLRRAHRPGVPWSHLAVLARTNAQLVVLEEHLRAAGVPCRLTGSGGLLRQPEVREALGAMGATGSAVPFAARLSDVEAMAAEGGAHERRLHLEALVRLARDYAALDPLATVDGFVAWLRAGERVEQPDAGGDADAVELTTFHRAKGLEWPVVFVTGLERGLVPIGHAVTPSAEAEERRLLYVALTRAVDELHCSWAERRTFGTRAVTRSASPYLAAMQEAVSALAGVGSPDEWRSRIAAERARLQGVDPRGRRPARGGRRGGAPRHPALLEALTAWRTATARASGVPAYVILHDATLAAVAEARPSTHDELLALPGLGPVKAQRYGDSLLAVLAAEAS